MKHVSLMIAFVAIGCGGNSGDDTQPMPGEATVGPTGGTVSLPEGPTLAIPAGALDSPTTITITSTSTQVAGAVTPLYQFEPSGLTFAIPVTVTIPVASPSSNLHVWWSKDGGAPGYDPLTTTVAASSVSAAVAHFSTGYVAPADETVVEGNDYKFVIDGMSLPRNNTEARNYGLDLNGDNTVDNQYGQVISTFESQGMSLAAENSGAIDRGETLTLLAVKSTDLANATAASVSTYLGATPQPAPCSGVNDTVCRHHLTGTGTFTIAASSPTNTPLVGKITSNVVTAGPGHAVVQLEFAHARPVTLNLLGARVKATTTSSSTLVSGVLGGGIAVSEVDSVIFPELAASLTSRLAADCTNSNGCVCAQGSTGQNIELQFDTNGDCMISPAELKANSLMQSLLAPDVMLEGQQCLSVGVGFTAVGGVFTLP